MFLILSILLIMSHYIDKYCKNIMKNKTLNSSLGSYIGMIFLNDSATSDESVLLLNQDTKNE